MPRLWRGCSMPVLNEVKNLSWIFRSFEAQDARGAHFEPLNLEPTIYPAGIFGLILTGGEPSGK